MDTQIALRHTLATLAYRTVRATEGAPPEFADFAGGGKSPVRILAHMGDLLEWALSLVQGDQKWNASEPGAWDVESGRFFRVLQELDSAVASTELVEKTVNRLFQGPIADALTHAGQITMLRRMAGCPIRGENYFVAEIESGRAGADQKPPRKPF